eukprot:1147571-Pelagomonas_calceolata.AAC.2
MRFVHCGASMYYISASSKEEYPLVMPGKCKAGQCVPECMQLSASPLSHEREMVVPLSKVNKGASVAASDETQSHSF